MILETSLLVGMLVVYQFLKIFCNVPSLLWYLVMSKWLREGKKKVWVKQLDKGNNTSRIKVKWEHILSNENVCCLFCLSWIFFKLSLHQTCAVRCTVFWTVNIPSAACVRKVCPWEATTDTMDNTSIPPHTTLLSKIKALNASLNFLKYL